MGRWFFNRKSKDRTDTATETTPRETNQMPAVPYRVLHSELPFYSDPECKQQVPDARIAILEALDPDISYTELDIVPTLKKYKAGQLVNWSLNNKRLWEECWYENPETDKIEQAWTLHVEFVGELISDRTIQENRATLDELEPNRETQSSESQVKKSIQ